MDDATLRAFEWNGWIVGDAPVRIFGKAHEYVESKDGVIGPREGMSFHVHSRTSEMSSVEAEDGTIVTLDKKRMLVTA